MKKVLLKPEGVRDIYGSEYEKLNYLTSRVQELFDRYGYTNIRTPSFEYITVFDKEKGTAPTSDLFKMVDKEGHTLVLRPDFTPSVARAVSMYYPEDVLPLRLCYRGSVFLNSSNFKGRLKEGSQMGVELINDPSVEADAEIISLVAEMMKACSIQDFMISIGNAAFFKALVKEVGLSSDETAELRNMLTMKNQFGAQEVIDSLELSDEMHAVFSELPMLFGGKDVLLKALSLTSNDEAAAEVKRMCALYDLCELYGCSQYISFDFGMLSDYTYYSGIIFNAMTYGLGDAVIKGGRYDSFVEKFGKTAPAVGFTASMDDILNIYDRTHAEDESMTKRTMIIYPESMNGRAIALAAALRKQALCVSLSVRKEGATVEEYTAHADKLMFSSLVFFGDNGKAEVIAVKSCNSDEETIRECLKEGAL